MFRSMRVKEVIRRLKALTVKAFDPELPPDLRPIIFAEFRRTEIELARLIQAAGEAVHFLA